MSKNFLKRSLSTVTAMAMFVSVFAASLLPVTAEETNQAEFTASVSAQLRASDSKYETIVAGSSKFLSGTTDAIEMTTKEGVYFGAFYQFAPITVPDGKAIKSVVLSIDRKESYKQIYFNVYKTSNPTNNTSINDVFSVVAPAVAGTKGSLVGATIDATVPTTDDNGTVSIDITNSFNANDTNSYFLNQSSASKRAISAAAKITVEYADVIQSGSAVTASVAAQLRASDDTWATKNSNSNNTKFVTGTDDIETTAKNYFGAFYHFDKIPVPENAVITKVTLAVYQGSSKFSGKHFYVLKTDLPSDITQIDDVFAVIAPAKNNSETTNAGLTTMVELNDEDKNRTETLDITNFYNKNSANAYFLYNSDSTDGNRKLSAKAEITVEYTMPEAILIHDGVTTSYAKFEDAYTNAQADDVITLLKDATTTKSVSYNLGNLTINGNGKKITNGSNYIAFDGSGTLTISNLTIEGAANLEIKSNSKIAANNLVVDSLKISGSKIASKGTLSDSDIDKLTIYAKLNLDNSTVDNVVFPNIKAGSADAPKITSNADFTATSIVVEKITTLDETEDYVLFDGEFVPSSVIISSPYDEAYTYSNGKITIAKSEPTATPTASPTATPTTSPTAEPTATPTSSPTAEPTATPTASPTVTPTASPTVTPTASPTVTPTAIPTTSPTAEPTATPTPTPSPTGMFDTDYTPESTKGVTEYEETTPLATWFSNNTEMGETVLNAVRTQNGKLMAVNGETDAEYPNLYVGKRYAEQKETKKASKIVLTFEYTAGSKDSRIYMLSASEDDVKNGVDSSTVGVSKTAWELGLSPNKTYDIKIEIDNSTNTAVFTITEKSSDLSLYSMENLTATNMPEDTNTIVFRPALGVTDAIDEFNSQLIAAVLAEVVIGDINQDKADKTVTTVTVSNPTAETNTGVLIAAIYDENGMCKQVKIVSADDGTVECEKTESGYVKAFLWNSLNDMTPILDTAAKTVK